MVPDVDDAGIGLPSTVQVNESVVESSSGSEMPDAVQPRVSCFVGVSGERSTDTLGLLFPSVMLAVPTSVSPYGSVAVAVQVRESPDAAIMLVSGSSDPVAPPVHS